MKPLLLALFVSSFAIPHSSFAEVRLPSIFTDHLVLQRDKAVPVWGKAAPGEEVVVELAGQKKTVKADAGGKWMVKLDPMPANAEPQVLKAGSLSVQDVLIGEVEGDAGDVGAGDCEGEEGEGGALGREGEKPEDWVLLS
jgi:sialate O-acetylesterase